MELTLFLDGLDCPHCAEEIRSGAEKLPGVQSAQMNFVAKKLALALDPSSDREQVAGQVKKLVSELEPDVKVSNLTSAPAGERNAEDSPAQKESRNQMIKIIAAGVLFLIGELAEKQVLPLPEWAGMLLLCASYLLVGLEVLWQAVRNIAKGRVFDENFLMAVATIGAVALGDLGEAAAVMLFYQVGEWFQGYAVRRSRRSISELMDIRPDSASVLRDGKFIKVTPEEVQVGDVIQVKPGEKVPLDGTVITGTSSLDTSALTGESLPQDVAEGSHVNSGCINRQGVLEIQVEKPFGESTVTKILDLVENASGKKAKAENFITRFSKVYTPLVVIAAVLLALLPPLILGNPFSMWIERALIFLVISCPCALVISIPLSFFGGIGGASRRGILIKGANYLEQLAKCETMVFDKTGTLTEGRFAVRSYHPAEGVTQEQLLEAAAAGEQYSSHPIAASVREAYQGMKQGAVQELQGLQAEELAGMGTRCIWNGSELLVGNRKLMEHAGIQVPESVGTTVYCAKDGKFYGYLVIGDQIKAGTKQALEDLRSAGVRRTVMLTGDTASAAEEVAREAGVKEYRAGLLPGGKVQEVEALMSQGEGLLAFVGDGINDAPVLARADVGIAMGGLGSDAAIEAADVVLMNDDLSALPLARRIAWKTLRIVRENIVLALAVKALVMVLGAFGIANMWMAVFADVGVALIAVLNAMRAMSVSSSSKREPAKEPAESRVKTA